MPYALASGFFSSRTGSRPRDILRYMLGHGSRLLGLVRAGAYPLYGTAPLSRSPAPTRSTALNVARFLADNDQPDQLVLSLYGTLARGDDAEHVRLRRGGDGRPARGAAYRSMYLPPNGGTSNSAFLETLRLDARPRDDATRDGRAGRARARVRDAARVARPREGRSPSATRRRASGRCRMPSPVTDSWSRSCSKLRRPRRCASDCVFPAASESRASTRTAARCRSTPRPRRSSCGPALRGLYDWSPAWR